MNNVLFVKKENRLLKYIIYLSFFASTFGSEAIGFPFLGIKMSPVRMLLILVIVMSLLKKRIKICSGLRNPTSMMLYWTLYAGVSLLWSRDISEGIKVTIIIAGITVFFICMTNFLNSNEDIVNCTKAFSLGIALQCLIGWQEIFTGVYKYARQEYAYVGIYTKYRLPVAMWSNVNNYATVLVFGCIASNIAFMCSKRKLYKAVYLFILINCVLLVLESQSRANIIALCIFAAVLLLISKKSKYFILPFALIVLMYIPNLTEYVTSSFRINISSSFSDSMRMMFITDGIGFLIDTIGFGVGPGQIASWSIAKRGALGGQMHNWWMEVLVSFGIITFIWYCYIYVRTIKANIEVNKFSCDKKANVISSSFIAFMLCFIIAGISSSSLIINEPMWILFCLVFTFVYINDKEKVCNE